MKITKQQDNAAKSVDLAEFLLNHHPNEVHQRYGSVLLNANPKVSVKLGYSGYKVWDTEETGGNVDYLIKFLNYDYVSAVLALTEGMTIDAGDSKTDDYVQVPIVKEREVKLPEQADNCKNVFAYLRSRGISSDTINDLINRKLLYQSKQGNNTVFLSKLGDFAEIRGTNTYAERRCKYRGECSNFMANEKNQCIYSNNCVDYKKDGFHGIRKARPDCFWGYSPYGKHEVLYVCEAAIDAISLFELHHDNGLDFNAVYVSLGGVANKQTIERLKKYGKVILAVDNDEAGQKCRDDNQDLEHIIPMGKDWNDDLKKERGR